MPRTIFRKRARSYLHVNCSHCHRFGAGGSALFDVRKELPLDKTHAINVRPNLGDFGIAEAKILCEGDPARSVMLYRMSKLGRERMPHVGSEVVDDRGVELVRQWVAGMGSPEISGEGAQGRAEQDAAVRQLEDRATPTLDVIAAADKLLSTTGGALLLICEIDAGRLPGETRQQAIARGMHAPQELVSDLFRRFDPAQGRAIGSAHESTRPNYSRSAAIRHAEKDLFRVERRLVCPLPSNKRRRR